MMIRDTEGVASSDALPFLPVVPIARGMDVDGGHIAYINTHPHNQSSKSSLGTGKRGGVTSDSGAGKRSGVSGDVSTASLRSNDVPADSREGLVGLR